MGFQEASETSYVVTPTLGVGRTSHALFGARFDRQYWPRRTFSDDTIVYQVFLL